MIITSTKNFTSRPKKIISLVPSQTELLFDLGLNAEVIGITRFCIHPGEWFISKIRVGGTKKVNINLVNKLSPDLIIANKEENEKDQVEELAEKYDVWVTDINTLEDGLAMIKDIGEITGKSDLAGGLITRIKMNFLELQTFNSENSYSTRSVHLPTAYLIWKDPYMTVGGDTFINDMMKHCGLQNIFESKMRYPCITVDELNKSSCQLVLLSSEPYPFKQKHVDELQQQLAGKRIILVNGEMFSWYGSRLLTVPFYFKKLMKNISRLK